MRVTHIGTATLLLELEGLRLLTDPVFDAPGEKWRFGFGTSSVHQETPALTAEQVGAVDAVLLSHDQHGDNLDHAGRAFAKRAPKVVTTVTASKRLGANTVGLAPFEATTLGGYTITATPARHGPPGSLPIVGPVVGFMIEGPSLAAPVYISGDTVWFDGVAEVARRWKPGVAFLHLGCVKFGISGPLRCTFDASDAVRAGQAFSDALIVPVHYEGWTHFTQGRAEFEAAFTAARLASRVRWLPRGEAISLPR